MRAACSITEAERGISFDTKMTLHISSSMLRTADLEQAEFHRIKSNHGLNSGDLIANKAVIANNLITDPSEAPKTNVHLKDLRMVVAIPIAGAMVRFILIRQYGKWCI